MIGHSHQKKYPKQKWNVRRNSAIFTLRSRHEELSYRRKPRRQDNRHAGYREYKEGRVESSKSPESHKNMWKLTSLYTYSLLLTSVSQLSLLGSLLIGFSERLLCCDVRLVDRHISCVGSYAYFNCALFYWQSFNVFDLYLIPHGSKKPFTKHIGLP